MNAALEGVQPHARHPFDVQAIRADFPILATRVNGRPLVYLDNAATTHKPRQVLDALENFYLTDNANIHRGVHTLSQRATAAFEAAREKVARFLNAADPAEIIFTRGTTEAINLVAQVSRAFGCRQATKSCSPVWSIMPTSSLGSRRRKSAAHASW